MDFIKMHGCGNDFVIIDSRSTDITLNLAQRVRLADRHTGIGCDQLIVLHPSTKAARKADVCMRIYNPNGSEAQACGNATRCVASLLAEETAKDKIIIETIERILPCQILKNREVNVNMGAAQDYTLLDLGEEYKIFNEAISVNVGNPHCVLLVDDAESVDVAHWGAKIEKHPAFPNHANVEFVSHIKENAFRVRVWERGTGITQACGSGATATAWALHLKRRRDTLLLHMDGGILTMRVQSNADILMQGATAFVFRGTIEL